jgi:phosphoadenosine phosphosulfate reductase
MAPLDTIPVFDDAVARAADLSAHYGHLDAGRLIELATAALFPRRIALVSSFGAESAVLLHLVAKVDPTIPVIFLDTGRLFAETLEYRTRLSDWLGLTDVRTVSPDPTRLQATDPYRALWMTNADLCCRVRKTEPLHRALRGFDAWLTGRKRFQSDQRATLPAFEADGDRIKINPLAGWSAEHVKSYAERHALPEHPLVSKGYPSIGCVPCTSRVSHGEDQRAGRWRGLDKTECGIHFSMESDGSGI